MTRYDLAKVLEEVKRDEEGRAGDTGPKILTQDEIRARARNRRRKVVGDKAPSK